VLSVAGWDLYRIQVQLDVALADTSCPDIGNEQAWTLLTLCCVHMSGTVYSLYV
jgi:hypothetical protein